MNADKKYSRLTPAVTVEIVKAVQSAPHSLDQLAVIGGVSKQAVGRCVMQMRQARHVHVQAWERDCRGRPTIPCYSWGDAPDVACPVDGRTSTDRMRDLRAKRKAGAV